MRSQPDKALIRLVSQQVADSTGYSPLREDVIEVIRSAHPQVDGNTGY